MKILHVHIYIYIYIYIFTFKASTIPMTKTTFKMTFQTLYVYIYIWDAQMPCLMTPGGDYNPSPGTHNEFPSLGGVFGFLWVPHKHLVKPC